MTGGFVMRFVAAPRHIDENGHVNNAVWLEWAQAIATAHWQAAAPAEHQAAYAWFVTRHEIDYRGNIREGEGVTARTFIPEDPSGARFVRCVDFSDDTGRVIVSVRSTWAMIARKTGRPLRIPREVSAPFAGR